MGRIVRLDRSIKLDMPNINGFTIDKESFDNAVNSDYILELMANGSFLVESSPNGLSEMVHCGILHGVDISSVWAKIIQIFDDYVDLEIIDEDKYLAVEDPVISFIYSANIGKDKISVLNILKAIIIPRQTHKNK